MSRHRPGDVHRVLQRLGHAQRAVQRDEPADHEGDAAALQTLRIAELVADDGELAQRRVEDSALQIGIALEHESENRSQQQQEREQRQEPVVRDERGEVWALVLGELVDDGEREARPPVAPLKRVEASRHAHGRRSADDQMHPVARRWPPGIVRAAGRTMRSRNPAQPAGVHGAVFASVEALDGDSADESVDQHQERSTVVGVQRIERFLDRRRPRRR